MIRETVGPRAICVAAILTLVAVVGVRHPRQPDPPSVWFVGYVDPASIVELGPQAYRMTLVPEVVSGVPRTAPIRVWFRGRMREPSCYRGAYVKGQLIGDHVAADVVMPDVTKYPGECWMSRCMPAGLGSDRLAAAKVACDDELALFR